MKSVKRIRHPEVNFWRYHITYDKEKDYIKTIYTGNYPLKIDVI